MSFNKNKKVDPRIRFQNQSFRSRLETQRNYKRSLKKIPQTGKEIFLSRIGLGSLKSRLIAGSSLAILVYIIFIPNVFFIKSIDIAGGNGDEIASAQNSIASYLGKTLPWPQKNLLTLSKKQLSAYLIKNNQKILKINGITKKFPNKLEINLTFRTNNFAVLQNMTLFNVAGDGLTTSVAAENFFATSTWPSGVIPVKLETDENLYAGKQAFSQNCAEFIKAAYTAITSIYPFQITDVELADASGQNIKFVSKNGPTLIFDASLNAQEVLERVKLLLGQFSTAEIQKISYVDMRFENKSYVCNKGQPCVKDIVLPNSYSTTTASTTP